MKVRAPNDLQVGVLVVHGALSTPSLVMGVGPLRPGKGDLNIHCYVLHDALSARE